MEVSRYCAHMAAEWDAGVDRSRNGTFLFRRGYMDYHSNRFTDYSLIVRGENGAILALLPANRDGDDVVSHGGLTYGGFVYDEQMTAALMLETLDAVCGMMAADGVREFIVKAVPHIYHRSPSGEFDYAAFRRGAVLYRRDVTTAVVPGQPMRWQQRRLRSLRKATAAGVTWRATDDFAAYWPILADNLASAHQLRPVHRLDEILLLRSRFPDQIKLYAAYRGDDMLAGVVVYETDRVAHAQYTASAPAGRACGALDALFHGLLTEVYAGKAYFNFGVSTEDEGSFLNDGLVRFKEGFGGRTITHDFYRIALGGSANGGTLPSDRTADGA